jgi:hypothetical protein
MVNFVADVAVSPEASLTTTVYEALASAGMVKVTVDDPLAPVVPPAVMVAVVPPTVTVSADPAAKPWAVIWAELPTVPLLGLRPVADAVTVKLVAEVAVFPEESVTTTLWGPLGTAGMVKVTVAEPLPAVVPPDAIVAVAPPTVTVRAELAAKPWAVILTPDVPTAPLVTVRLVREAETPKLVAEVALSPEASVTSTVSAP